MKKRFHNKIMIASVILVLIVSLAACGGKADSGATDETTESKPPESSATVSESKDAAIDASEEAKTESKVDEAPVETPADKETESTQPSKKPAEKPTEKPAPTPTPTEKPAEKPVSKPASHTHNWVEHRVEIPVFVENIVPVYETQKVQVGNNKISDGWYWHCNCGAVMPSNNGEEHRFAHIEAGEPSNGYSEEHFHDEPVYEDQQVQVGTEDKSYWETESYVDYVYCSECGAKK